MRTRVDLPLLAESSRFALRFACEDCMHFDDLGDRCVHGYPSAPRRLALGASALSFCKEFELGNPADGAAS